MTTELMQSLGKYGFENASPIQELTIGPVLEGKDIFAQAETGSGKTGAFVIPIVEKFNKTKSDENNDIRYVVLSPTRELAQQTHKVFSQLGEHSGILSCCIIGGESFVEQKKVLAKGPAVLVATPGRMCDLIKQKEINLSACEIMVFDEADRLFDMGFQKDIEFILRNAGNQRQLIMLSATSNQEVLRTAYKFNSHPEELRLNEDSLMVDHIQHKMAMVSSDEKFPLLVNTLRQKEDAYAIVFCNTQIQTHSVAEWLIKMGLKAQPISGRLSQNRRTKLLQDFRDKKVTILVCTDVAARGLDIKEVNLVVNYDLPSEAANYVHRIGRTGRAGESGEAISFCAHEDCEHFESIKALIEADIEKIPLSDEDFATDICARPYIDRKTLRVVKRDAPSKKREPRKNTKPERKREPRAESKPETPRVPKQDQRFIRLEGYRPKDLHDEVLKHFRVKDATLIDQEVLEQGRRKFFFFGPKKTKYKFYLKPIYKKLLLPFLITIIKQSKLSLFVKVSYKNSTLSVSFSGKDEKMLKADNFDLLKAFEQLITTYLQSKIYVSRSLKISVNVGKERFERENKHSKEDKNLEQSMAKLAKSKRKLVLEKKKPVLLKPLNSKERRLIHQFFQDDKQVKTTSIGEGNLKKIELSLK